jgi:hypothetical protein
MYSRQGSAPLGENRMRGFSLLHDESVVDRLRWARRGQITAIGGKRNAASGCKDWREALIASRAASCWVAVATAEHFRSQPRLIEFSP